MISIDLAVLSVVTGGGSTVATDMVKSVDEFADRLRRSSPRQVRALANCDYRASQDRASGDPARIARAEKANCLDLLAPARGRR